MNQNFRSIWNTALASWVAVPETQSSKGKKNSSKVTSTNLFLSGISISSFFLLSNFSSAALACNIGDGEQISTTSLSPSCDRNGDQSIDIQGAIGTTNNPREAISSKNGGSIVINGNVSILSDPSQIITSNKDTTGILSSGSNSHIEINGFLKSTTSYKGISSIGSQNTIKISDANITITGSIPATYKYGLEAKNSSKIISTGDIKIQGIQGDSAGVLALDVDSGGTIEIQGNLSTEFTDGGISAKNASTLKLGSADITVNAALPNQYGIKLDSQSTLLVSKNLNVTDISTSPMFTSGSTISLKGGSFLDVSEKLTVNTISNGVASTGTDTLLIMGSGDFSSTQSGRVSLATASEGKIISKGDVNINTSGKDSVALQSSSNGVINIEGKLTSKTNGYALFTNNGKINLNNADIILTGGNKNSAAVRTLMSGEVSSTGDVNIDTTVSPDLYGILAQTQGRANINGHLTVNSSGSSLVSQGVNSRILIKSADVTTNDSKASGLSTSSTASIEISNNLSITGLSAGNITGVNATTGSQVTVGGELSSNTTGSGITTTDANTLVDIGSINIIAKNSYGISANSGSTINIKNYSKISTIADSAAGAVTSGNGSKIVLGKNGEITTIGNSADAIRVNNGAQLTGGQFSLTTSGRLASGLVVSTSTASSAPDAFLTSAKIRASGENASGIQIGSNTNKNTGYVQITDWLDIETTGLANQTGPVSCRVGAAICVSGDKSRLDGSTMSAPSKIVSSGYALQIDGGDGIDVALNNALLTTTGSFSVIEVRDTTGTSQLNLDNSKVQAGSSGLLLNVGKNSALKIQSSNTSFVGDITAADGNGLNFNLGSNSSLHGSIQGAKNLNLAANSQWNVTQSSMMQSLSNAGNITFSHTENFSQSIFKTITVNDYVGSDGWLNISTHLGNENSPTDKLIVNGGTATGTTILNVTRYSGLGAPTEGGKGIQVIEAANGATTSTNAFSLYGGLVPGGAYDYSLERNKDESWYLVSRLADPVDPIDPIDPVDPVDPDPSPQRLRPELSLYSAGPSLAILQTAAMMDSMHERKGGNQGWRQSSPNAGPLWVRILRNQGTIKPRRALRGELGGQSFDHHTNGIQLGADLLRRENEQGLRTEAGLYFSYADSSSNVDHFDGRKSGNKKLRSRSLGGYWSNFFANGTYIDVIGQYSNHSMTANSMRMLSLSTTGHSGALSVEVGHPFAINEAWTLEPQAQLRIHRGHFNDADDEAGLVHFGSIKSLQGRVGVRAAHLSNQGTFWGRVDWIQEMQGRSSTSLSAMSGEHAVDTPASLKGGALALTGGIDKQLRPNMFAYAAGHYKWLASNRGHSYGISAGIKWQW